jgi:hypothetical protein
MLRRSQNGGKTAKNGNFYTEFAKMNCFLAFIARC